MSLLWIVKGTPAGQSAGADETTLGKRVTGFHPLIDNDGGHIESDDDARRRVIAESQLPAHRRNPTRLDRNGVKQHVLSSYTTSVPIASFITLEEDKISDEERARMRADRLGGGQQDAPSIGANQNQLIKLIEGLNADLKSLWNNGEKVKALRVAIQATKLLSVNKVPHCFPSVFVLVATVLDTFGNFVSERLNATAAGKSFVVASLLKRGQDASADLIPPEAVEMCYNWFLKISSIRELLPRICIELSLLKCNKFLAKKARVQAVDVVVRLAKQIRGVADPLVACHLRWYLFMRASEVLKHDEWASALESTCLDSFATLEQLKSSHFERLWQEKDISRQHYLYLFMPALQWQLDTIVAYGKKGAGQSGDVDASVTSQKSKKSAVRESLASSPTSGVGGSGGASVGTAAFLRAVFEMSNKYVSSSALLLPLIRAFPPPIWCQFGFDTLLYHIDEVECSRHASKLRLMEAFALMIAEHDAPLPLSRAKKTALLNEAWGRVEAMGSEPTADRAEFIDACSALLQFCAVHMSAKQVNLLLKVAREAVDAAPSPTAIQASVYRLLAGLASRLDISALLSSKHILPLLRHVPTEGRHLLAKTMLRLVPRSDEFAEVALELAKMLNETLDILTLSQEQRHECIAVVVASLRAVASDDAEHEIEHMCAARHALPNLDEAKTALVHHALSLVHKFGKNSRRRNAAKAFLAFCHVTIPAATSVFARIRMALEAAATAFLYGFVAQGEAILRLATDVLKEVVPASTKPDGTVVSHDRDIVEVVSGLVALGVVTPSHAKYGHHYVISAVLAWNESFPWAPSSTGRGDINTTILRCLSKARTAALTYRFEKCGTENYPLDEDFVATTLELATAAATATICSLRAVGDHPPFPSAVGHVAMSLFDACVIFGDTLADDAVKMREFAAESWAVANQHHTGTDVEYTRALASRSRYAMAYLGTEGFERATNITQAKLARKLLEKELASAKEQEEAEGVEEQYEEEEQEERGEEQE